METIIGLTILIIIELMLLGALVIFIAGWYAIIKTGGVPFVSVPLPVAQKAAAIISLKKGDVFYDLGCGDGRVVREIARTNPGITAIGIEIAFLPLILARIRTPKKRLPNAQIQGGDFRSHDLSDATHIFMYLMPTVVKNCEEWFAGMLAPGTELVLCDFPFKNKKPFATYQVKTRWQTYTLFHYKW